MEMFVLCFAGQQRQQSQVSELACKSLFRADVACQSGGTCLFGLWQASACGSEDEGTLERSLWHDHKAVIASRLNVQADTTQGSIRVSQEHHFGEGAFRLSEDAQFLFVFPTSQESVAQVLCSSSGKLPSP